jgi:hypothetical protein
MENKLEFNNWYKLQEYADYGFSDISSIVVGEKDNIFKQKPANVLFKVDYFLDRLTEILNGESKKIVRKWAEEILWTDNSHLMETNVNPFGSLRITTRKHIKDLNGEITPICKDVFDIDEKHNGKEYDVAEVVYERIKKIRAQNYDYALKEYKDIEKLAVALYKACLNEYPSYIMFPKGLKKIEENYYKIFFEFKGSGAGAPGNVRAEQFDIDLAFDKDKGLLKCWGYGIDSPMKQRLFIASPSEWCEYFSPKEDKNKIIKCIIKTLMTY